MASSVLEPYGLTIHEDGHLNILCEYGSVLNQLFSGEGKSTGDVSVVGLKCYRGLNRLRRLSRSVLLSWPGCGSPGLDTNVFPVKCNDIVVIVLLNYAEV